MILNLSVYVVLIAAIIYTWNAARYSNLNKKRFASYKS